MQYMQIKGIYIYLRFAVLQLIKLYFFEYDNTLSPGNAYDTV